jgi:uncharacterized protein YqjF (DUF2071 family)
MQIEAPAPASEPFLTAEWRQLLMLNYPVEREVLEPFVPAGTMLGTYKGRAYLSLVGFLFLKTRLLGVPVPFHQDFEEVNLRFYVRRFAGSEWRRGVVFIKEIVPKPAIALVARVVYNENYVSLPMRHRIDTGATGKLESVEYYWELDGRWNRLRAETSDEPTEPAPASLEEFITELYWGYAAQPDGGCVEYQVEHPRWRVWPVTGSAFDGDTAKLYGEVFVAALNAPPTSAFIAEGSEVTVFKGRRIPS